MDKLLTGTFEDRPIIKKCYVEGEYWITLESLNKILETLIIDQQVQLMLEPDSATIQLLAGRDIIHPQPKEYTYMYQLKNADLCTQMWQELHGTKEPKKMSGLLDFSSTGQNSIIPPYSV